MKELIKITETTEESSDVYSFSQMHLQEIVQIATKLDATQIEHIAKLLHELRKSSGRLFMLGVGGSAANCAHAVNDFRILAGIECYTPTDNSSELTARVNDSGWSTTYSEWLKVSRLQPLDMIFVLSVGGGDEIRNISPNLVYALKYAQTIGTKIVGIVSRDGGYTASVADACVIIPSVNPDHITPHAESFQSIILHTLISHPLVKRKNTKWETSVSSTST